MGSGVRSGHMAWTEGKKQSQRVRRTGREFRRFWRNPLYDVAAERKKTFGFG